MTVVEEHYLGIACQGAEAFAVRAVRVAVHRISGGSYLRTWTAPYSRSFQYPTFYEDEFWIVRGDNVIEKETFSGDIISSFSVPSNNDIAFYDDEIFLIVMLLTQFKYTPYLVLS
jgi:hypothetical protein